MKNNKILKFLLPIAFVLIIFAIIGKKQGWFGKALTVKVAIENAEARTITETITANGKIQPEKEVKISPDVSGEIVELTIKEGDQVEKGQLLLRIKPDTYISQRDRSLAAISSSRARLAQSEAQFTQAELSFNRSKQLYDEQTISKSDFEQAQASYTVAKAEVEAAKFSVVSSEASLKEANEMLTKTSIFAPMSGTVSMLLVELGERVAGTNLMAGTELLRVADLSRMEAQVQVNENDIVRVNLGDTALIEVDAYLDQKFKGIVTEIANSAKTTGVSADQVTTLMSRYLLFLDHIKNWLMPARLILSDQVCRPQWIFRPNPRKILLLFLYNLLPHVQTLQKYQEHQQMTMCVQLFSQRMELMHLRRMLKQGSRTTHTLRSCRELLPATALSLPLSVL